MNTEEKCARLKHLVEEGLASLGIHGSADVTETPDTTFGDGTGREFNIEFVRADGVVCGMSCCCRESARRTIEDGAKFAVKQMADWWSRYNTGEMAEQYVGTKLVAAWKQQRDGRDGYAVKYADGYTSWSPKDTFEEAYRPLGDIGHLEPWQQRVVAELAELKDKLGKLSMFMQSDAFKHSDQHSQHLLERQYMCMASYADVLQERISLFTAAPAVA